MSEQSLAERLNRIKLVLTDCDGVLTDGKIYYTSGGQEIKAFHAQDGKGLKLLEGEGIISGIITGRESQMVTRRARELGIKEVHQEINDKLEIFHKIIHKYDLSAAETVYIGDDINDIPVLKKSGFSAAVADAVKEVKNEVDYVTEKKGGCGALREVIDLILKYRSEPEGGREYSQQ